MTPPRKLVQFFCIAHPELTREQHAAVLGIDVRTLHRYLSGKTSVHGSTVRLLEAFKFSAQIESALIEQHAKGT